MASALHVVLPMMRMLLAPQMKMAWRVAICKRRRRRRNRNALHVDFLAILRRIPQPHGSAAFFKPLGVGSKDPLSAITRAHLGGKTTGSILGLVGSLATSSANLGTQQGFQEGIRALRATLIDAVGNNPQLISHARLLSRAHDVLLNELLQLWPRMEIILEQGLYALVSELGQQIDGVPGWTTPLGQEFLAQMQDGVSWYEFIQHTYHLVFTRTYKQQEKWLRLDAWWGKWRDDVRKAGGFADDDDWKASLSFASIQESWMQQFAEQLHAPWTNAAKALPSILAAIVHSSLQPEDRRRVLDDDVDLKAVVARVAGTLLVSLPEEAKSFTANAKIFAVEQGSTEALKVGSVIKRGKKGGQSYKGFRMLKERQVAKGEKKEEAYVVLLVVDFLVANVSDVGLVNQRIVDLLTWLSSNKEVTPSFLENVPKKRSSEKKKTTTSSKKSKSTAPTWTRPEGAAVAYCVRVAENAETELIRPFSLGSCLTTVDERSAWVADVVKFCTFFQLGQEQGAKYAEWLLRTSRQTDLTVDAGKRSAHEKVTHDIIIALRDRIKQEYPMRSSHSKFRAKGISTHHQNCS